MSLIDLFHEINVAYQTQGDTHCRPGWVNMLCPFCHSGKLHLGIHISQWYANCWGCGYHPLEQTLSLITGLPEFQIRDAVRRHRGGAPPPQTIKSTDKKIKIHPFRLPPCGPLKSNHRRYLDKRRFDPDQIHKDWNVMGSGPVAFLDKIDYRFRLIAPIQWDGADVSFQSRDVTGRSSVKYLACPPGREQISHKDLIYGRQERWKDIGICVEGITDVWRLGPNAFATFGLQVGPAQLLKMVKQFTKVVILFDSEPVAQKRAHVLASRLRGAGVHVHIETARAADPADLDADDAKHLVKQLTMKG